MNPKELEGCTKLFYQDNLYKSKIVQIRNCTNQKSKLVKDRFKMVTMQKFIVFGMLAMPVVGVQMEVSKQLDNADADSDDNNSMEDVDFDLDGGNSQDVITKGNNNITI